MLPRKTLKSRAPFPAIWDVFCALIWMILLNLLVPLFQDFKHLNHCILTLSQPKGNLWAYFEYFRYWFVFFWDSKREGGGAYAGYALCWIRHCDVTPHIHIPVYLPESLYTSNQHSALTSAIGQIFIEWADPGHLQGWPLPDGRKSALFAHV